MLVILSFHEVLLFMHYHVTKLKKRKKFIKLTYFQPRICRQELQCMSFTVCNPLVSCRSSIGPRAIFTLKKQMINDHKKTKKFSFVHIKSIKPKSYHTTSLTTLVRKSTSIRHFHAHDFNYQITQIMK